MKMLLKVVENLSFNPEAYNKPLKNVLGKDIYKKPSVNLRGEKDKLMQLSFVDSVFEMWKLRWTIKRAKVNLLLQASLKSTTT